MGWWTARGSTARPGRPLNLAATPAPTPAAAAEALSRHVLVFDAADPRRRPVPRHRRRPRRQRHPRIHAQRNTPGSIRVKQSCQSCHALGSQNIRHPRQELGEFPELDRDVGAAHPVRPGHGQHGGLDRAPRAGEGPLAVRRLDRPHRRAASCRPTSRPGRRASSATWWSACGTGPTPTTYLHDAISTDKRQPTLFPNGLIYGSPEESTDDVPVLDPVNAPRLDGQAPLCRSGHAEPAGRAARAFALLGRGADLGRPYQQPQPDHRREGPGLVRRPHPRRRRPAGLVQGRRRPSFRQGRADRRRRPAPLGLRPEDAEIRPDRHLLRHPPPVFRLRRRQHAVDQLGRRRRAARWAG